MDSGLDVTLREDPAAWTSWLALARQLRSEGDVRADLIELEHQAWMDRLAPRDDVRAFTNSRWLPSGTHWSRADRGVREARRRELVERHERAWLAGLKLPKSVRLEWLGGFVVGATVGGPKASSALESLVETPAGRFLSKLVVTGPVPVSLMTSPALKSIRALVLGSGVTVGQARGLLGREELQSVRSLSLHNPTLGDDEIAELVGEQALPALATLDLRSCRVQQAGCRAIGRRRGLQALDLGSTPIGVEGARELAKAEHLDTLTTLDLFGCSIGSSGARAIADAEHFGRLRHLALAKNEIDEAGAVALLESGRMAHLESVNLGANAIGSAGVRALFEAPRSALRIVQLHACRLSGKELAPLSACDGMSALKWLVLSSNPLGEAGCNLVARAPAVNSLDALSLSYCQLGGVHGLPESGAASVLTALDLDGNSLVNADAERLSRSQFPRLRRLSLNENDIWRAGAEALRSSTTLLALEEVHLEENPHASD